MSLQSHLTNILNKALAARARAERTEALIDVAETKVKDLTMTPQMEAALNPLFETLEEVSTPSPTEYASIDSTLDDIENILG